MSFDPVTERHLERQIDSLAREFAGVFSRATVERVVREAVAEFSGATVTEFVPILGHRHGRERLRALARLEALAEREAI